ncbi:hypothetical protein AC578_4051 [Pseudocercospora eumusae]|uniref:F-box domain-containing protein n=1 Tax=Pseudocercospora eumusae TaxID=321146 RepID=A0A139GX72_9PEZI|nr:hypothetical protein AC578_4051 [Pseudocercospora eumusae]
MNASETKRRTTLTDLPPELWDHIGNHLQTASSVASLGRCNKSLHAFVANDAWKSFARNHFPSICPIESPSFRDTARSLSTLSKAWDKRAFVARYVEPRGRITALPGRKHSDKWRRPRGQTIGFTPQLDVYEEIGPRWQDRKETLAFSAGAEICVRNTNRADGRDDVRWTTYRPLSANEGRDDVTALHLLRPDQGDDDGKQKIISGTANGDLQLVSLPDPEDEYDQDVRITYFATQGLAVRSSDLLSREGQADLLAATLGDSRIVLYEIDSEKPKICPSTQLEIEPGLRADGHPSPNHRAWTTTFLSSSSLAVGAGPSEEPIHIYSITEAGLSREGSRKIGLRSDLNRVDETKKPYSSVYSIVPLPSSNGSASDGTAFLSGAYDGIIRLHDLRSDREVEQIYVDIADDSAIYSILPQGRERVVAGTSRHNLLKVFDLRLGAKCYSHLDAANQSSAKAAPMDPYSDYNIFLRRNSSQAGFTSRGNGWSRSRSIESSIYNLASSSPHSPYIYAGVENAVMSIAFTEILDAHPDPVFFDAWSFAHEKNGKAATRTFESQEVVGLAMYDQGANMKLCVQRSPWETWRACQPKSGSRVAALIDERWKGANEFGP